MQFIMGTAFGVLNVSDSVQVQVVLKTQGYMQGNDTALAVWAVVSIFIIHTHKKKIMEHKLSVL